MKVNKFSEQAFHSISTLVFFGIWYFLIEN